MKATVEGQEGWVTLAFYKYDRQMLVQLKSKRPYYDSVDAARAAAHLALFRYPYIEYANICFQPVNGSVRSLEKVER